MTPLPPDPDKSTHIDDAKALVRALANRDTGGALALIHSLDRNELEHIALYLARGAANLVLNAHVEELDWVLQGLRAVNEVESAEGPAEEMERQADELRLARRLVNTVIEQIEGRRDYFAGTEKEG
ncbi:hypothetical protein [Rhodococcus pyridinivorans]|uniref:Uncharacterized protein n=1 Tax=Rhodococcus pyridinivorans TaxID=103816 RepID=A0A7M2XJR7_9NOCA|nr:hypothetical protein [Rhodococcus pyridinivorans]QOV97230.1 hypothetical protein INP59_14770 [Rhodococcus pyridinivorans]